VTAADIEETTKMFRIMSGCTFEDAPTVGPEGPELPRLRCFLIFKDEDPTGLDYVRVLWWCMPSLQKMWYGLDKEYSRAVSRLAIPVLLIEINIRRQPREAKQFFGSIAMNPDVFSPLVEAAEAGDDELLWERFERIDAQLNAKKDGGSGS